jgi:hypothetical protein
VQLADRVLVMSRRPATIQTVVPVELERPRDLDAPEYLQTRDRIFAAMGMSHKIGEELPHTAMGGGVPGGASMSTLGQSGLADKRAGGRSVSPLGGGSGRAGQ